MIAYNNDRLNNLLVRKQADTAFDRQCINSEEKTKIYNAYPAGFYSPHIFVRIGLFILTCIIVQFSLGLVTLLFATAVNDKSLGGLFIFFGMGIYAGLEFMVKKNHYKSGVDDALMWMAAACIIGGANAATNVSPLMNAILVFIIALVFFLRFTNAVMAGVACLAAMAMVFLTVARFGEAAKAITPFIIMTVSAVVYFWMESWRKKDSAALHANGLLIIAIIALVCFYVAGNYYVVREASIAMFNLELKEGQSIPFGWLFWIFTIVIPVIYIARGIQQKDPVLLRVGLLLVAGIVFTVRYYYHILPAETAMVIGGVFFIALAYGLMKYLHKPKYGFTHKETDDKFFMDKLQLESLVIAQTFSGPQMTTDTGIQFGGGSGGGGGAGAEF